MNRYEQAEHLIRSGQTPRDVASTLGISHSAAKHMNRLGGYQAYLAYKRSQYRKTTPTGRPSKGPFRQYDYDASAVVAAVNAGASYGAVAKRFSITRGVVSGILQRQRRAAA